MDLLTPWPVSNLHLLSFFQLTPENSHHLACAKLAALGAFASLTGRRRDKFSSAALTLQRCLYNLKTRVEKNTVFSNCTSMGGEVAFHVFNYFVVRFV